LLNPARKRFLMGGRIRKNLELKGAEPPAVRAVRKVKTL
jgi:hypothetical protein